MPHASTDDKLVEQPTIDATLLATRGWVSLTVSLLCESDLREQLLALASGLGTPTATRFGGSLCDTLLPTQPNAAKSRSLSKIHAVGEFPLHMDTAHWLTPCRYVILGCVSPGSGSRPIPLNEHQVSLLHSTPLRVTSGRNSFFSTILSKTRPFLRFDPGCMTATTPDGAETIAVLLRHNWHNYIETVHWKSGTVLVMDNWRLLHGRGQANRSDCDRKLLRISIL
jgi:hypothetical protein